MVDQDIRPEKRRLVVFSDVFIAIVLVVMAADLRNVLPMNPTRLIDWVPEIHRLLTYVLGFFTLGVVWVNHSLLTGALEQATRGMMWLNLNLMFWISFFPVSVRLLGRGDALEHGAVIYGLVLTAMSASIFSLRAFVRARNRDNPDMVALSEVSTYRSGAAFLICAGSVPLAFVSPWISIACFVVAPALFLFPESRPVRA